MNIQETQDIWKKLTPREIEIAKASVEGLTAGQIGDRLGIQKSTISTFRIRIVEKLGCRTFIEACACLIKGGIL